jgi:hypothetical protein
VDEPYINGKWYVFLKEGEKVSSIADSSKPEKYRARVLELLIKHDFFDSNEKIMFYLQNYPGSFDVLIANETIRKKMSMMNFAFKNKEWAEILRTKFEVLSDLSKPVEYANTIVELVRSALFVHLLKL